MDVTTVAVILTIIFSLAFAVANGRSDSANAIATVISTRVLAPWKAIIFGTILNFAGAFLGEGVANTVGREVADPAHLSQAVFLWFRPWAV